jgi:hypothetical protein
MFDEGYQIARISPHSNIFELPIFNTLFIELHLNYTYLKLVEEASS